MGSTSFVESFVTKVLHEDLGTISSLPMFINLQMTFAMLSLCYPQCSGYLLHIAFPSPYILQHYAKFDTRTIVTLEKLLGVGSLGGFINHLACHQVALPIFSSRFSFLFVVWTTTPHSWMLGIYRSCTCHSFSIGRSPYSSKCNNTC